MSADSEPQCFWGSWEAWIPHMAPALAELMVNDGGGRGACAVFRLLHGFPQTVNDRGWCMVY